jgi:hypothetical protein
VLSLLFALFFAWFCCFVGVVQTSHHFIVAYFKLDLLEMTEKTDTQIIETGDSVKVKQVLDDAAMEAVS